MSNEIKLLDLKPNQALLDATFDGYKLSLDPISKIKFSLPNPPHKHSPSEEQYSSLHAQLFSLQNHLVRDPWFTYFTYFADTYRNIQCIKYNERTGKVEPLTCVYRLRQCESSPNDYNITFTFISAKYCVLGDGLGGLHLIDTGDRYTICEWKTIYSFSGLHQFHIQDAKFEVTDGKESVWCLILHIEYVETSFVTFLNLIRLTQDETEGWIKTDVKEIRLKNLPTYCSLEPKASAIILCTDRHVNLNNDNSDKPVVFQIDEEQHERPFSFTWSQLDDDIFIEFKLNGTYEKSDFKVVSDSQWISVTFKNEVLMKGKLFGEIDSDLITWSIENKYTGERYMQVTLVKKDGSHSEWTTLLAEQDPTDEEGKSEIQKFGLTSVLQSEIEDCDVDMNDLDNDYNLLRIETKSFKPTHKLYLGSNRPLFTLHQHYDLLPAIAIRSDVDALLWAPTFTDSNPSDWSLTHLATLNAFGYVQASKVQRKYMQCSLDAKYAVICEPHRHVFIYKVDHSSAIGLKKRKGGKISLGQQKLFSLEEQDEIVGIVVENELTILLTEKYLFVLQINA